MAEGVYRRLTRGRVRSAFAIAITSRSSLWLGLDHLLVIDTSGYTETYKRFYFRDIQCFTVAPSERRLIWNWVLAILACFCVTIWWAYFRFHALGMTSAIVALATVLLFAVPLFMNNLLGPTCTCYLSTAVQTEHLCGIKRFRQAHRIMDQLRPLILQAQVVEALPGTSAPEHAPPAETVSLSGGEAPTVETGDIPPRIVS